jgi:hypothetical protein
MPGHPSIRLLDDSREAILGSAEGPSGPADHRGKLRFLSGPQIRHVDDPMPLRAIYYIGEGLAPAPVIEPMPPAEAAMALVRHSFLLDVDTAELLATHFGDVSEIGTLPIHFRLDYPRHFEGLAPVRDAIGTHLRDVGLE